MSKVKGADRRYSQVKETEFMDDVQFSSSVKKPMAVERKNWNIEGSKAPAPLEEINLSQAQNINPNSIVNNWIKGLTPMSKRRHEESHCEFNSTGHLNHSNILNNNPAKSPKRVTTKINLTNKENATPKNVVKIKGTKENILGVVTKEPSPVQKRNPMTPKKKKTPRAQGNQSKSPAGQPAVAKIGLNLEIKDCLQAQKQQQQQQERTMNEYYERGSEPPKRETIHKTSGSTEISMLNAQSFSEIKDANGMIKLSKILTPLENMLERFNQTSPNDLYNKYFKNLKSSENLGLPPLEILRGNSKSENNGDLELSLVNELEIDGISHRDVLKLLKKNFLCYQNGKKKIVCGSWSRIPSIYFSKLLIEEFPELVGENVMEEQVSVKFREKLRSLIRNDENESYVCLRKLDKLTRKTGLLGLIVQGLKELGQQEELSDESKVLRYEEENSIYSQRFVPPQQPSPNNRQVRLRSTPNSFGNALGSTAFVNNESFMSYNINNSNILNSNMHPTGHLLGGGHHRGTPVGSLLNHNVLNAPTNVNPSAQNLVNIQAYKELLNLCFEEGMSRQLDLFKEKSDAEYTKLKMLEGNILKMTEKLNERIGVYKGVMEERKKESMKQLSNAELTEKLRESEKERTAALKLVQQLSERVETLTKENEGKTKLIIKLTEETPVPASEETNKDSPSRKCLTSNINLSNKKISMSPFSTKERKFASSSQLIPSDGSLKAPFDLVRVLKNSFDRLRLMVPAATEIALESTGEMVMALWDSLPSLTFDYMVGSEEAVSYLEMFVQMSETLTAARYFEMKKWISETPALQAKLAKIEINHVPSTQGCWRKYLNHYKRATVCPEIGKLPSNTMEFSFQSSQNNGLTYLGEKAAVELVNILTLHKDFLEQCFGEINTDYNNIKRHEADYKLWWKELILCETLIGLFTNERTNLKNSLQGLYKKLQFVKVPAYGQEDLIRELKIWFLERVGIVNALYLVRKKEAEDGAVDLVMKIFEEVKIEGYCEFIQSISNLHTFELLCDIVSKYEDREPTLLKTLEMIKIISYTVNLNEQVQEKMRDFLEALCEKIKLKKFSTELLEPVQIIRKNLRIFINGVNDSK